MSECGRPFLTPCEMMMQPLPVAFTLLLFSCATLDTEVGCGRLSQALPRPSNVIRVTGTIIEAMEPPPPVHVPPIRTRARDVWDGARRALRTASAV